MEIIKLILRYFITGWFSTAIIHDIVELNGNLTVFGFVLVIIYAIIVSAIMENLGPLKIQIID